MAIGEWWSGYDPLSNQCCEGSDRTLFVAPRAWHGPISLRLYPDNTTTWHHDMLEISYGRCVMRCGPALCSLFYAAVVLLMF